MRDRNAAWRSQAPGSFHLRNGLSSRVLVGSIVFLMTISALPLVEGHAGTSLPSGKTPGEASRLGGLPHSPASRASAAPTAANPLWVAANLAGVSPPVNETGTVVATIPSTASFYGDAYDPANGFVYAPAITVDSVYVYNATALVGTIPVPGGPAYAAFDPVTRDMWVSSVTSGNLSIINNLTVVSTLATTSPGGPTFMVYDPITDCMIIALSYANGMNEFCQDGSSAFATTGQTPEGVTFDPRNSYIEIANLGENDVTIYNGSTFPGSYVGKVHVGTNPFFITYDPGNGFVYVSNSGSGNVTLIQGTTANYNLAVGNSPSGVTYDPANGVLYIANFADGTLSYVLPSSLGPSGLTIPVGHNTEAIAYDPMDGLLYVSTLGQGISLVSTLLGITPAWAALGSIPVNAVDVGQGFYAETDLYAVGSGQQHTSVGLAPTSGMGCNPVPSGPSATGTILTTCMPSAPGTYQIWINDTDSLGAHVWSHATVVVDPAPAVTLSVSPMGVIDRGQTLQFVAGPSGGTGSYSYAWNNLPPGCANKNAPTLNCTPTATGAFSVSVTLQDTNGANVASNAVGFTVDSTLSPVTLSASRHLLDVGQSLSLGARVSGGSGGNTFSWAGLPPGCLSADSAAISCAPTAAGAFSVSVTAVDASGASVTSASASITVSPALLLSGLTSSASATDAGVAVTFGVAVSGGASGTAYAWSGLPAGCASANAATLSCTPSTTGYFSVLVTVNDSNEASVSSVPVALVVNPALGTPSVTVSASSLTTGQEVVFTASVRGGTEPYTYTWSGLPSGCSSANSAVISCIPSNSGMSTVSVSVSDVSGSKASSAGVSFQANAQPQSQPVSSLNLPIWILIGLVVATLIVALLALATQGRKPKAPSPLQPASVPQQASPPYPQSSSQPPMPGSSTSQQPPLPGPSQP